jgi:hypothetical protein
VHHDVEAQVWLFLELDQFLIEVADVVKRQPRNRVLNPKPLWVSLETFAKSFQWTPRKFHYPHGTV